LAVFRAASKSFLFTIVWGAADRELLKKAKLVNRTIANCNFTDNLATDMGTDLLGLYIAWWTASSRPSHKRINASIKRLGRIHKDVV